jgi:hypothetical protein
VKLWVDVRDLGEHHAAGADVEAEIATNRPGQ